MVLSVSYSGKENSSLILQTLINSLFILFLVSPAISVYAMADLDGDGILDADDADIDGDGIPNLIETNSGLDPENATDASLDSDNDGWLNLDEYRLGTGIDNLLSTPANLTNPYQKIFAADAASNELFGNSVFITDDRAIIGAYQEDGTMINSGAAYIFEKDSNGIWIPQGKLTASDASANDFYGISVSITSDTAVVGAYLDDDNGGNSGAVYVYTRDINGVWGQEVKLTPADGEASDLFGFSVSIIADTLLVGAYGDDDEASAAGAVYVYTRDNTGDWSESDKLTASDAAANDNFGYSIHQLGNRAVIGARLGDGNTTDSGNAYVFSKDSSGNWSEEDELFASDGAAGDRFGTSAFIDSNTIVIGAPWEDDNGNNAGAAYVFTDNGTGNWSQQSKLLAADGSAADNFGVSVSVSGLTAIVGAELDDPDGSASGAAYIFSRVDTSSWQQQVKLRALDAAANDQFGISVSMTDDIALIGALRNDVNVSDTGTAYFYDLDLDNDGLINAIEDTNNNGVQSIGETDFRDADSDDDGLLDGAEDINANGVFDDGETDPLKPDTDGDGIQDGTESGIDTPVIAFGGLWSIAGTDTGIFIPDLDTATTTDPTETDTDEDGFTDGQEDLNANGRIDSGESNPDDISSIPESTSVPLPGWLVLMLMLNIFWIMHSQRHNEGSLRESSSK